MALLSVDHNRAVRRYHSTRRILVAQRRHWVNPGRTSEWWDNLWSGRMLDEDWKMNLRMNKELFLKLVEELKVDLEPNPEAIRDDVLLPEKKVAIALYYLKDQGSLLMTCNTFGVGKSTLSETVKKVCAVINQRLGPKVLKLPQHQNIMFVPLAHVGLVVASLPCLGCCCCLCTVVTFVGLCSGYAHEPRLESRLYALIWKYKYLLFYYSFDYCLSH